MLNAKFPFIFYFFIGISWGIFLIYFEEELKDLFFRNATNTNYFTIFLQIVSLFLN